MYAFSPFFPFLLFCQHFRKLFLIPEIISPKVWPVVFFVLPLHSLSPILRVVSLIFFVLWHSYIERQVVQEVQAFSFPALVARFGFCLSFFRKSPFFPFPWLVLGRFHGFRIAVLTGSARAVSFFGNLAPPHDFLQWRVWSWLRMNASYRLNTCKSRGIMSVACNRWWRPANGWVTRIQPAPGRGITRRKAA